MRAEDISVGDIVVFRDWTDMEKEFGLDEYGNIGCEVAFASAMQYLCGTECKVVELKSTVCGCEVRLSDIHTGYRPDRDWTIMPYMLMPVDSVPVFPVEGFDAIINFEAAL